MSREREPAGRRPGPGLGTGIESGAGGQIRGLIFDFDGLILDTEGPEYDAWCAIYRQHGCELPLDAWAAGIGTHGVFDPFAHLEQLSGRAVARAVIGAAHRAHFSTAVAGLPVLPGVVDYLDAAARLGLRVGLASSSAREWVEGHLTRLGLLDHFACLRCQGDAPRVKPAPDLYLAALDGLGLRPDEAIAFEDSPHGVSAATAAGLFCVAVPNRLTRTLALDHAHLRLASLADLPLQRLLERCGGASRSAGAISPEAISAARTARRAARRAGDASVAPGTARSRDRS